jgi:hypothetical protein
MRWTALAFVELAYWQWKKRNEHMEATRKFKVVLW